MAHVYLWAGLADWARLTFHRLPEPRDARCTRWREEQPLRGSAVAAYVGDMPHNWASAECVLYLRHMLALEDGDALRLLCGIGAPELASGEPWQIKGSPTRFGRVTLSLEPSGSSRWTLRFDRPSGRPPGRLELPARIGTLGLVRLTGASSRTVGDRVHVVPTARAFEATFGG